MIHPFHTLWDSHVHLSATLGPNWPIAYPNARPTQSADDDGRNPILDTINGFTTGPSKDSITDSTKVIDTSFAFDFDDLLAGLI